MRGVLWRTFQARDGRGQSAGHRNTRCPVAGFFGNDDRNPPPEDVDDYSAALSAAGVEHTFHRYDGAGHAFQSFNSERAYRPEQSEDASEKVLAFMAERLK
ncbi:MAG: dienelactone hydrolase family protein [Gammaproteobacteria bacterium]|nr:dienelactone hydrolase family protein [Gammaproteobacteria bacterium]